jgi:hypothetical protein
MAVTYYKALNWNMRSHVFYPGKEDKGFRYKIGEIYNLTPTISFPDNRVVVCQHGFHYCNRLYGVYFYYPESSGTRVFVIEPGGTRAYKFDPVYRFRKYACSRIRLIRELSRSEIFEILEKERQDLMKKWPYDKIGLSADGWLPVSRIEDIIVHLMESFTESDRRHAKREQLYGSRRSKRNQ